MSLIVLRVGTKVRTESVVIPVEIVVIILFHMVTGKMFVKDEGLNLMNANDIILEVKTLSAPNAGIEALVRCDCCIMDETCEPYPYKEEDCCPDWKRCDNPEYMLACLASRNPEQIAEWVVDVYNSAMKTDESRISGCLSRKGENKR